MKKLFTLMIILVALTACTVQPTREVVVYTASEYT